MPREEDLVFLRLAHRASVKTGNNADENEQLCTRMQSSDIEINGRDKSAPQSPALIQKITQEYREHRPAVVIVRRLLLLLNLSTRRDLWSALQKRSTLILGLGCSESETIYIDRVAANGLICGRCKIKPLEIPCTSCMRKTIPRPDD